MIPSYGSALNPIDITAQALNEEDIFPETVRTTVEDEGVDAVVLTTTFGTKLRRRICLDLVEIDRSTPKPILLTLTMSREFTGDGPGVLREGGIPVFRSPLRTTRSLANRWRPHAHTLPGRPHRQCPLGPPPQLARSERESNPPRRGPSAPW